MPGKLWIHSSYNEPDHGTFRFMMQIPAVKAHKSPEMLHLNASCDISAFFIHPQLFPGGLPWRDVMTCYKLGQLWTFHNWQKWYLICVHHTMCRISLKYLVLKCLYSYGLPWVHLAHYIDYSVLVPWWCSALTICAAVLFSTWMKQGCLPFTHKVWAQQTLQDRGGVRQHTQLPGPRMCQVYTRTAGWPWALSVLQAFEILLAFLGAG